MHFFSVDTKKTQLLTVEKLKRVSNGNNSEQFIHHEQIISTGLNLHIIPPYPSMSAEKRQRELEEKTQFIRDFSL